MHIVIEIVLLVTSFKLAQHKRLYVDIHLSLFRILWYLAVNAGCAVSVNAGCAVSVNAGCAVSVNAGCAVVKATHYSKHGTLWQELLLQYDHAY